eukprot:m.90087 g.90087  ORF g.90087 m.90087 type:complete len:978 (+) comp26364_c0_seq1:96-3029(+)
MASISAYTWRSRIVITIVVTLVMFTTFPTGSAAGTQGTFPDHLTGNVSAVVALVERVLPGSSDHFDFTIVPQPPPPANPEGAPANGFTLKDGADGKIVITATTASELTGGLGIYLREFCNITVGWVRGGGNHVFMPSPWPTIGDGVVVVRNRSVAYSHVTQVCTHSYTLAWHDWTQWEKFIDWMALAGHNSIVAPTGQEEVQYKVLTEQFGLTDMQVRNWTNGPGFLTWSRGQNSHGNGIAGPLPRSFMQSQWALQRQILQRYRELGIAGHQPAFQGNAPWAIAAAQNDTGKGGATEGTGGAVDTAWIDGRDPLYTRVADAWVKQIIADFGSDHVWQMDAFFSNGTGWGEEAPTNDDIDALHQHQALTNVTCTWSQAYPNTYLNGCAKNASEANADEFDFNTSADAKVPPVRHLCPRFYTIAEAKLACTSSPLYIGCSGVTTRSDGSVELRAGASPITVSPSFNETSYLIENLPLCKKLPTDPVWLARGKAAYGAIAKADGPTARWVFQGWALHVPNSGLSPPSPKTLARLHGFSEAAPPGQFILLDMGAEGEGEWIDWHGTWGIPFVWTSLHVFGGNQGLKGDISETNAIPWEAPPFVAVAHEADPRTQAIGVGYTPEGLDQNPAYYELLQEAAFKTGPEQNLTTWLITRAHRRYGLTEDTDANVASAWARLGASVYSHDGAVHDCTGVASIPGSEKCEAWNGFSGKQPTPAMCKEWHAWGDLIAAAPAVLSANKGLCVGRASQTTNTDTDAGGSDGSGLPLTFTYDLVDVGREVLAQLTNPVSGDFSRAVWANSLKADNVNTTGLVYETLLRDLDRLLMSDVAFLLGPWLQSARNLGGNATDCTDTRCPALDSGRCDDFMEWNARAQITTWYPTLHPGQENPGNGDRDGDYARKQWGGLVGDYYATRVSLYIKQALADARKGGSMDKKALDKSLASLSYTFQTDFGNVGPLTPVGDPVAISTELKTKYASYFSSC